MSLALRRASSALLRPALSSAVSKVLIRSELGNASRPFSSLPPTSSSSTPPASKTYYESASSFARGCVRTLSKDSGHDATFLYNPCRVESFTPRSPLQELGLFEKNSKGEFMRIVVTLPGSAAAFNAEDLLDQGSVEDLVIPAQRAIEGIKEVAGYLKIVANLMVGKGRQIPDENGQCGVYKHVRFIGVNYGQDALNPLYLRLTNWFPESFSSSRAKAFSEKLLPLFSSECEIQWDGTANGKRKPLEEVIAGVNRVTFVGHSYGSSFMRQVTNVMKQHLRDLNYNEKEIAAIFNAFVYVGFGAVTHAIYDDKCPLNSIIFASPSDDRSKELIARYEKLVPLEIQNGTQNVAIKGLVHNTTLVWGPLITYGSFKTIRTCNGKEEWVYDEKHHNFKTYVSLQRILEDGTILRNHLTVVTLARSVLRNATERTSHETTSETTTEELLKYNPNILDNAVDQEMFKNQSELPTLAGTREITEPEINAAISRAKEERDIEIGRV